MYVTFLDLEFSNKQTYVQNTLLFEEIQTVCYFTVANRDGFDGNKWLITQSYIKVTQVYKKLPQ